MFEDFPEAEILAIGPFHPDIADCLGYPVDRYVNVPMGTPVTTELLGCYYEGSIRYLAEAVGISNPWDFAQHPINSSNLNKQRILEILEPYDDDHVPADVDKLMRLNKAGFELFFALKRTSQDCLADGT